MTSQFNRINAQDIKLGMRFTAPVFFDDGENMFLAEEKSIKNYHLLALKRWNVRYLLTYGRLLDSNSDETSEYDYDLEELEEVEPA